MKKLISLLVFSYISITLSFGQCVTDTSLLYGYSYPSVDTTMNAMFNCIEQGVDYEDFLSISTPSSVSGLNISFAIIIEIQGLPDGICWEMVIPNDTIFPNEISCVRFFGNTTADTGWYKIDIFGCTEINGLGLLCGNLYCSSGFPAPPCYHYKFRLISNNASCPDTMYTLHQTGVNCKPTSVVDNFNEPQYSTVYPNPTNNTATIEWNSYSPNFTFELFDVSGRKVLVDNKQTGKSYLLNKGNLQEGFYIYQISNQGKNMGQGKVVFY